MEVVSRKRSGDVTILFFGDLGSFRFAHRLLLSAHFLYSRRLSYGRVSFGALVFHERAKKILASADHPLPCNAGRPDSIHIGFRRRTLHLHAFLKQLAVRLRGESHTFLPSEIVYAQ